MSNTGRSKMPQKLKLLRRFQGQDGIADMAFSPDGRWLATADGNALGDSSGDTRLWDIKTGKLRQVIKTPDAFAVAFSPGGALLATGKKGVLLFDVVTGKKLKFLNAHPGKFIERTYDDGENKYRYAPAEAIVYHLQFSPDGSVLAVSSNDKTIELWDIAGGTLLHKLQGHSYAVDSIRFSADGKKLVSGGGDNTVRVWEVATGRMQRNWRAGEESVTGVSFLPGDQAVVSVDLQGGLCRWSVVTGKLLSRRKTAWGSNAAFSSDQSWFVNMQFDIAVGGGYGTIQVCDTQQGRLLAEENTNPINALAISPDDKLIAAAVGAHTIELYQVQSNSIGTSKSTATG